MEIIQSTRFSLLTAGNWSLIRFEVIFHQTNTVYNIGKEEQKWMKEEEDIIRQKITLLVYAMNEKIY